MRSVQWRTGIAARQLGELDKARTTLSSVVDLYFEAHHDGGRGPRAVLASASPCTTRAISRRRRPSSARRWSSSPRPNWRRTGPGRCTRWRRWSGTAAQIAEALDLLREALVAAPGERVACTARRGRTSSSARCVCGWATCRARRRELRAALELYGRTRDERGEAWALTQLARARLVDGEPSAGGGRAAPGAVPAPRQRGRARRGVDAVLPGPGAGGDAATATRRCASWSGPARCSRRMRDVYGLACARHHSAPGHPRPAGGADRLAAQLRLRPAAPAGRPRRTSSGSGSRTARRGPAWSWR